jgi:phosphate transport system permease protein
MLKDAVARHLVAVGGISVIIFITLIFVYLAYVVLPLFYAADVLTTNRFPLTNTQDPVIHMALEEQTEVAGVFRRSGRVEFLDARSGALRYEQTRVGPTQRVTSFSAGDPTTGIAAYGLSDGSAIVFAPRFSSEFRGQQRTIVPSIRFPAEQQRTVIDTNKHPLIAVAAQSNDKHTTLIGATDDDRVLMIHGERVESFLEENSELKFTLYGLPAIDHAVDFLLIDKAQENVFAVSRQGLLTQINVRTKADVRVVETLPITGPGIDITALHFLAGDVSLLVGDSAGHISQWSSVRQHDNTVRLTKLREFIPGRGGICGNYWGWDR